MAETPFPLQKKIAELEAIEAYFRQPDLNLEEAIDRHTKALALAKEILAYLDTAETTLKKADIRLGDSSEPAEE